LEDRPHCRVTPIATRTACFNFRDVMAIIESSYEPRQGVLRCS
jgi:hypothetical protein